MIIHQCSSMGVSGTTDVHVRETAEGYEARVGIALLGMVNNPGGPDNPFHPEFNDNYASGVGATEEEAINAMKRDMQSISDSLWL